MTTSCYLPTITYATLGAKGQIVIPKEAREKLHIGPGDKVVLIIEEGRMMVINPDGVQQMIQYLQESIDHDKLQDSLKSSKKSSKKSSTNLLSNNSK